MNTPAFPGSAAATNAEERHMGRPLVNSTDARTGSEDDVHISLGIQGGIGQAWSAALSRVGAISLAWRNEADLAAQPKSAREIDPSLVFDRAHAASASQASKASTKSASQEPRLSKWASDSDKLDAVGRTHNSHTQTTERRRSSNQTAMPTDSKAKRNQDCPADQRPPFYSRPQRTPPAGNSVPVAHTGTSNVAVGTNAGTDTPHRMSIRLERLLPHPKTPDSASVANTILISPRLNRYRRILHGQRRYHGSKEVHEVSRTLPWDTGLRRRTNSLPNLTKCDLRKASLHPASKKDTATTSGPSVQHERVPLSSLEDQVSDMFTELGLNSPYTDESGRAAADQRSNVHKSDQIPWFYQPRYTTEAAALGSPNQERPSIVLNDDDSSCAETTAESTAFSNQGYQHPKGGLGPNIPAELHGRRRSTTNTIDSMHSTAIGSAASNVLHCLHGRVVPTPRMHPSSQQVNAGKCSSGRHCTLRLAPEDTLCTGCRDGQKTCCQMHTVLGRMEQAERFIQNVGRHASAVDALLADLRAQSRVLSETLLVSQSRASSLNHTLVGAIDAALGLAGQGDGQSRISSVSMMDVRPNNHQLAQYSRFSKHAHILQTRAGDLSSKEKGKAQTRESHGSAIPNATKNEAHVRSWLDSVAMARTDRIDSASESEFDPDITMRKDELPANSTSCVASRSAHKDRKRANRSNRRHRRPVQPIAVRVQRIGKQWDQLQTSIEDLGIANFQKCEPPSSSGAYKESPELLSLQLTSQITADSLKLIQRILKTTNEALDAARSSPNMSNG